MRRLDWIGKKPPASLYRRWPKILVDIVFSDTDEWYSKARWPYPDFKQAEKWSGSYPKSYFSIKKLLKNAGTIKCAICFTPFKHWPDREAFNARYTAWWHRKEKAMRRWMASVQTRTDRDELDYWDYGTKPPYFCSERCRKRNLEHELRMQRAMNLRRMFHEWAVNMYYEFLEQARAYQQTEGRKIRELKVMISAARKVLKEKQDEVRNEDSAGRSRWERAEEFDESKEAHKDRR